MTRLTGETGSICHHSHIAWSCDDCKAEHAAAQKKAEEQAAEAEKNDKKK